MNNRFQTIDSFLKFIRDLELQNPGFIDQPGAKDRIYGQLVRIGVSGQDRQFKVNLNFFDKWVKRFSKKKNIDVFVSDNWKYFCQFTNNDKELLASPEHIKIYIPQDAAHIEKSANLIFDFLAKHNIQHHSKIGSDIRVDNIVIRLINPEDEIKLRQFINKNSYIQQGLIPANPFLFQIDGIALACDGRLSFNSTVSKYITLYIQARKRENRLNDVSINDFYTFVSNYYQQTFINKTNIKNVMKELDVKYDSLANYMNVTELLLKSMDSRFGYSDYMDHFKKCSNRYLIDQQEHALQNSYQAALNNQSQPNQKNEPSNTEWLITDQIRNQTNQMLTRMINVLAIRYKHQTYDRIRLYLETGNVNYMPSDDPNLRGDLSRSSFREQLNQILANDGISLHDYLMTYNKQQQNERNIDSKQVAELFVFAYQGLAEKYDHEGAIAHINAYLKTGKPDYLTRNRGVREVISSSTFREDMNFILQNTTLNEYIDSVIDRTQTVREEKKSKEDILKEALLTTYRKQEQKFVRGESPISGTDWIISAIMQLITANSYKGFTRDNNARQMLLDNVTREDVLNIIVQFYGVDIKNSLNNPNVLKMYANAYAADVVNQEKNYQY